ncbi:transposase [Streptomyces sp. DG1A-41]|uniref:transposase n=1 Tax=Streptomyces sp. DG1A-41 TaxID=3125779 RepID=UPI0030D37A8D
MISHNGALDSLPAWWRRYHSGKTIAEVADELGINETTLASWVSRARRAGTAPGGDSDELERLRRENAHLKRDN